MHLAVDWERITKLVGKLFLLFLEYCVKLTAIVTTTVVLAADGSFGRKLGSGFGSIAASLRTFFEAPSEIITKAHVIHDYTILSSTAFNRKYGSGAIHETLSYLNGGIVYLQDIYGNFTSQPFSTFFASLIAFFSLYLISRILRFTRQKGMGSYFQRQERRLAGHIFKNPKDLYKPKSDPKPSPEVREQPRQSIPKTRPGTTTEGKTFPKKKKTTNHPFGDAAKENKHLQDYLKRTKR